MCLQRGALRDEGAFGCVPGRIRNRLPGRTGGAPGEDHPARLLAEHARANETAAVATLRNVISAQAQFQMSAKADTDNDNNGEYGGFIEMSGAAPGRMAGILTPPVLSGAFRALTANGEVLR